MEIRDTIGEYRLDRPLGRGGMGTLYVGHKRGARGFEHEVAIKLAHHGDDEDAARMFVREARISVMLRHPNIVRVEDFGEEDGTLYLVMEHVPGCSLHQLLRMLEGSRESLPIPLAVHVAAQTAEALYAAHTATDDAGAPLGVVHRDVNPPNILLSSVGEVKLCDFGIAKARDHSTRGGLKGKFGYMSPEQAHGRPLDARSDIYALGVVLWEMLAGQRLFRGRTDLDRLLQAREAEVPDLREVSPDVPEALSRLVARALAREPADRPSSARELADALTAIAPPQPAFPRQLEALVRRVGDSPARVAHAPKPKPATATRPPAWGDADPPTRPMTSPGPGPEAPPTAIHPPPAGAARSQPPASKRAWWLPVGALAVSLPLGAAIGALAWPAGEPTRAALPMADQAGVAGEVDAAEEDAPGPPEDPPAARPTEPPEPTATIVPTEPAPVAASAPREVPLPRQRRPRPAARGRRRQPTGPDEDLPLLDLRFPESERSAP